MIAKDSSGRSPKIGRGEGAQIGDSIAAEKTSPGTLRSAAGTLKSVAEKKTKTKLKE